MRIEPGQKAPGVEALEAKLKRAEEGLGRGDLNSKRYARLRQAILAELGRSKIRPHFEAGETLEAEHHWVQANEVFPLSPLRERAQVAESLYATDRRLFRWCFQDASVPGARPIEGFEERLECRWFRDIAEVARRRQYRWPEAAAGLAIAVAAWLMRGHLSVTGPILLSVGLFAVVHAAAWPTRWVALVSGDPSESEWEVAAPGKKSGRTLIGAVVSHLPG